MNFNNCVKINTDYYININYSDRNYGSPDNYTVILNNAISNVTEIKLLDISAEVSDTIIRSGSCIFTVNSYDSSGNSLNTFNTSIYPKYNNIKESIELFNLELDAYCNITVPDNSRNNNLTYATFTLLNNSNDAAIVFTDHQGILEKFYNIPYNKFYIINNPDVINSLNSQDFNSEKVYIFYNNNATNPEPLVINSLYSFTYTSVSTQLHPNADTTYTEPLQNKSIVFFLETINGDSINSMISNNNNVNNSFFILDPSLTIMNNIMTSTVSVTSMSTPIRNVPLINKVFTIPIKITGFKIRVMYSDNSKYTLDESANRGKTTMTLLVKTTTAP